MGIPIWCGLGWLALVAMGVLLNFAASSCTGPSPEEPDNAVFWIQTIHNEALDEQSLRFVADNAGMVVLDARLDGPSPAYDYAAIVDRLHELRPGLPVLLYTWANSWYDTGLAGSATLAGFPDLGSLLLRNAQGEPIGSKQAANYRLGDVRKREFREWMVDRIEAMVERTDTDGVALDVAMRKPESCTTETEFCREYAEGMETLFSSLERNLQPETILLYNGLWSFGEGMLESQKRLLPSSDAVAIEYFGLDPLRQRSSFNGDILPYVKLMQKTPQKTFLVFGRGPWRYTDYREDYLWQRYLYSSYLLGAGEDDLFKYHASFELPARNGRTGPLDAYADWEYDLGDPSGPYEKRGGLYLRQFSEGLVLVAPHDGLPQKFSLPEAMYTPEGKELSGELQIQPGQGLLLLSEASKVPRSPRKDFESPDPPFASWRWAEIHTGDGGNRYLCLSRTPEGQEQEHDLSLEPVRSLKERPRLRLRLRTTDPGAKLLARVEVDDVSKQYAYVVLETSPRSASNHEPAAVAADIPYRSAYDVPYRRAQGLKVEVPYIPTDAAVKPDGRWRTLDIDAGRLLEGGRYSFRRWDYIRLVGSMDVDDIEVLGQED